ncbi:hypothetical protein diail_831 [Diaporthe ilicicola]|nr:hypothetical protein diail_831 [Diaporthe ilicicola]
MPPPPTDPISLKLGLLCTYKQYKADTETIAGWLKANAVKHGYKFDRKDGISIRTSDFVPMAQKIVANVKQAWFSLNPAIHDAFRRAIVARQKCTAWYEQNTKSQWKSNESHAYFTNILLTCWDILLSASANRPEPKHQAPQPPHKENIPQAQPASVEDELAAHSNRFAALYIGPDGDSDSDDEPEVTNAQSSSLNNQTKQGKKSKSPFTSTPATIIADETQIEEEFWFAIQSFLREQQKVREQVKGYWKDFNGEKTHLIMATFGTRMAIDLIRRSEIELDLQVVRPKRFPADQYPVHTFPALLVAAKQDRCPPMRLDHIVDPRLGRIAGVLISGPQNELTLYNTYATLKAWRNAVDDGCNKWLKNAMVEWNDESDRLTRILFMLFEMSMVEPTPPYQDDITRGVTEALWSGKIPIWTTFSLKLLLDIEDILGEFQLLTWGIAGDHALNHATSTPTHWHHQADCCHVPLPPPNAPGNVNSPKQPDDKHKASPASKTINIRGKVKSSEGPRMRGMVKKRLPKKKAANAPPIGEEVKVCTLRCGYDSYDKDVYCVKEWIKFHVLEQFGDTYSPESPYDVVDASPYDVLRMNPLHCGMIVYDLYRSRHWSGLYQNTCDNRDIWTMMYVYAAGRSVFPDSLAWPDMEFLLYQLDDKYVFFGGRPVDLQWAARKWMLAMGNSSTGLSYRDLSHLQCCTLRFAVNHKKWRPLKDNSVLGSFIKTRTNCCEIHQADAHDNFMEMIRVMHRPDSLLRLARFLNMSQDEAKTFVTTWTNRLHSWTLMDILELTQMYLAVDLADVGFDWAVLDDTCSQMWKEARPLLRIQHSDSRDDGDGDCDHEDCNVGRQPSNWTTILLSQAAEVEVNLSSKKKNNPAVFAEELEKGSPTFMKLWSLIQEHCRRRVNTNLGHGIFSSYAAEECLIKLLDTRNEAPYPARIVAPHVRKCFEGYSENLLEQSSSMKLAEKILAGNPGTLHVLQKAKHDE